jgi:hypothetical protein
VCVCVCGLVYGLDLIFVTEFSLNRVSSIHKPTMQALWEKRPVKDMYIDMADRDYQRCVYVYGWRVCIFCMALYHMTFATFPPVM